MTDQLILIENTYVTKEQADDYLKGSARAATAWAALGNVDRRRALISAFREIEKSIFEGAATDVEYADTAAVAVGGTGYTANDIVTIVGGTGAAAQFKVTAETGGVVTAVVVVDDERGGYTTTPTNPASVTGGTGGDDLTLNVAYKTQTASFPRTSLTDKYGQSVDSFLTPVDIEAAQIELGFEISQDTDIEGSEGTGSNRKRVKAGTAEVEFFKPTDGTRLPTIVQTLINPFLGSGQGSSGSTSSGTGCPSQFDDSDTYTRTHAFP